jgi:phage antirepressor YoqD-like protein
MKQEKVFWFEEVCLTLNVTKTELYNFLVDSGFCYYKRSYDRPIAYKRFARPLKSRKKKEHGFFVIRKTDSCEYFTLVTEAGLKYIKEHIKDVEFTYTEDISNI